MESKDMIFQIVYVNPGTTTRRPAWATTLSRPAFPKLSTREKTGNDSVYIMKVVRVLGPLRVNISTIQEIKVVNNYHITI